MLDEYFGISSCNYEPFVSEDKKENIINKEDLGQYKVVMNFAIFQHIRSRKDLDEVNAYVSEDGCLIIQMVNCENIPVDPDWFYYRPPVHCALTPNKSMDILMEQ